MEAGQKLIFLSLVRIFSKIFVQQKVVHYCRFSNLMSQKLKKIAKGKPVEAIFKNAFSMTKSNLELEDTEANEVSLL